MCISTWAWMIRVWITVETPCREFKVKGGWGDWERLKDREWNVIGLLLTSVYYHNYYHSSIQNLICTQAYRCTCIHSYILIHSLVYSGEAQSQYGKNKFFFFIFIFLIKKKDKGFFLFLCLVFFLFFFLNFIPKKTFIYLFFASRTISAGSQYLFFLNDGGSNYPRIDLAFN